MDISEFIQESKHKSLEYAVFSNWHQPTPSWADFDNLYDRSIEVGRISLEGRILTPEMQYFLDQSKDAYPDIEYDIYIMESLNYRNLDPADSGTPKHSDPKDILHWQCRGATEWIIGKNDDVVILEPGDLLWFQANTNHKTSNLTEKCSLIFTEKDI
jgi:mannose-6-phosphate isomerase-like protein (cupin superfamily)